MTDIAADRPHEDRVLPAAVYGLYILSIPSVWVAVLIGLVVAYANRDTAGPRMKSHYEFLIQTFWKGIWWAMFSIVLIVVGGILSIVLIGIPAFIAGWVLLGAIHIWFYVRCLVGLLYLVRDEAYPRPQAWLF
ncbi:MAG: hypothetical protein Q8L66_07115 [Caulobacter sp.]|nr:hypothetical protein [Caulobacter sp.]